LLPAPNRRAAALRETIATVSLSTWTVPAVPAGFSHIEIACVWVPHIRILPPALYLWSQSSHSLANRHSCLTLAKNEGIVIEKVGPQKLDILWLGPIANQQTIFVYL